MQCAVCHQDKDRVVDSRSCEKGSAIRRRRECLGCRRRFTTYERVEVASRVVVKKDGRREPFDPKKLLKGLQTACQKRPISGDQLDRLVDRVEADLFGESDREVSTRAIGEKVIEELKALDKVAYVRFASVYREFADVREFAAVLLPFLPEGHGLTNGQRAEGLFPPRSPSAPRSVPVSGSLDSPGGTNGGRRSSAASLSPKGRDGAAAAPPRVRSPLNPSKGTSVKSEWRKGIPIKEIRNGNHSGGT